MRAIIQAGVERMIPEGSSLKAGDQVEIIELSEYNDAHLIGNITPTGHTDYGWVRAEVVGLSPASPALAGME